MNATGENRTEVKSVQDRAKWAQMETVKLDFHLGLIDLRDLNEKIIDIYQQEGSTEPNASYQTLLAEESPDPYLNVLSKQRQLLYRQKDLLDDHKNELDSKKTTLEKMAKNTGQQNLKKNYDKLETSYKQLSAKLDDIEKCHNDLDSAMKDLKRKHELITSSRTGCTEKKEKLEQELSQVTSELKHLEVSRFTDPVQLGNYIRNLEAHSQQITDLRDSIERQKDELFIPWGDFLDLTQCQNNLKHYGRIQRLPDSKLDEGFKKNRPSGEVKKMYLQGRYFDRRHVQPYLNRVDRFLPEKTGDPLRHCANFRDIKLTPLRPSVKGKFKKGQRLWGCGIGAKQPSRNNLDINLRVTSEPVDAYIFVNDEMGQNKRALKYETRCNFALMAGTGKEGAVPIHLEYPLEELATRDGKRVFARVVPPGRTAERFKFQETSEEKDLSEEHKARVEQDVAYLRKCRMEFQKVHRETKSNTVPVKEIYERHAAAVQRSLELQEALAQPLSSPVLRSPKEEEEMAQQKEREKQQKQKQKEREALEKKRREEEEAKRRRREAEEEKILDAQYRQNLMRKQEEEIAKEKEPKKQKNKQKPREGDVEEKQQCEEPEAKKQSIGAKSEAILYVQDGEVFRVDLLRRIDEMADMFDHFPRMFRDGKEKSPKAMQLDLQNRCYTYGTIGAFCDVICNLLQNQNNYFRLENLLMEGYGRVPAMIRMFRNDSSQCLLTLSNTAEMFSGVSLLNLMLTQNCGPLGKKTSSVLLSILKSNGKNANENLQLIYETMATFNELIWGRSGQGSVESALIKQMSRGIEERPIEKFLPKVFELKTRKEKGELKVNENWHPRLKQMWENYDVSDWAIWSTSAVRVVMNASVAHKHFNTLRK